MGGAVVGVAIALFCALIAAPLIWDSRRRNQRWIDVKSEFGLLPITLLVCAAIGIVIALVSAISAWG